MGTATAVDARTFRNTMAGVCAPVTVVTTSHGGLPHGATVSSFASLSLDPPLVSVALDRRSRLLAEILAAQRFGVNVLGADQDDVAQLFARRDTERFAGTDWHEDRGLPRLDGTAAWLACALDQVVPGGDHLLLCGLVTSASSRPAPPLIYAHRTFGTHSRYQDRPRPPIVDQIAAYCR